MVNWPVLRHVGTFRMRYASISALVLVGCVGSRYQSPTEVPRLPDGSPLATVQVTLVDRTPLARVPIHVRCASYEEILISDKRGRVLIPARPGTCRLKSRIGRLDATITVSSDERQLVIVDLAPIHRLKLDWSLASGPTFGTIVLDETLPQSVSLPDVDLEISDGFLRISGLAPVPVAKLRRDQELKAGHYLFRVQSIEARPWMPLELRAPPTGVELAELPVRRQGIRPIGITRLLLGEINVFYLAPCRNVGGRLARGLEELNDAYRLSRAHVGLIVTEDCALDTGFRPRNATSVYFGSAEVLWALQSEVGDIVVVDGIGQVRERIRGALEQREGEPNHAPIEQVARAINRSWPTYAAKSRVTVHDASSIVEAEARRLITDARRNLLARKYQEARSAIDRAVALLPNSSDARWERANVRARIGDLSGVVEDVTWWRTRFGDESADRLLDQAMRQLRALLLRK